MLVSLTWIRYYPQPYLVSDLSFSSDFLLPSLGVFEITSSLKTTVTSDDNVIRFQNKDREVMLKLFRILDRVNSAERCSCEKPQRMGIGQFMVLRLELFLRSGLFFCSWKSRLFAFVTLAVLGFPIINVRPEWLVKKKEGAGVQTSVDITLAISLCHY